MGSNREPRRRQNHARFTWVYPAHAHADGVETGVSAHKLFTTS